MYLASGYEMRYVCLKHPTVSLLIREEMEPGTFTANIGLSTVRLVSPCQLCAQENHIEGFDEAVELAKEHREI
jgi:hypothetical protein